MEFVEFVEAAEDPVEKMAAQQVKLKGDQGRCPDLLKMRACRPLSVYRLQ